MKKNLFFMMALAALLLTSCNEDVSVREIKGGYHYKTAGQVTVTTSEGESSDHAFSESGLMEVTSLHNGDSILITLNQTNGGVYKLPAVVKNDQIEFAPFYKQMTISELSLSSGSISTSESYIILVSGHGEVYDDLLYFYFDYQGQSKNGSTLVGQNIQMLANKN